VNPRGFGLLKCTRDKLPSPGDIGASTSSEALTSKSSACGMSMICVRWSRHLQRSIYAGYVKPFKANSDSTRDLVFRVVKKLSYCTRSHRSPLSRLMAELLISECVKLCTIITYHALVLGPQVVPEGFLCLSMRVTDGLLCYAMISCESLQQLGLVSIVQVINKGKCFFFFAHDSGKMILII
jgi:hypothetical protein